MKWEKKRVDGVHLYIRFLIDGHCWPAGAVAVVFLFVFLFFSNRPRAGPITGCCFFTRSSSYHSRFLHVYIVSLLMYMPSSPPDIFLKFFRTRKETWSKRTHAADGLFRYHTWPSPVHFSYFFSCVAFYYFNFFCLLKKLNFLKFQFKFSANFWAFKNFNLEYLKNLKDWERAIKSCINILNPPKKNPFRVK